MRFSRTTLLLFLLTLCAVVTRPSAQDRPPADVGLREETERRLVQIDVTVTGPEQAISSLTKPDFELIVMGRHIDDFSVDRVCVEPTLLASKSSGAPAATESTPTTPDAPAAPLRIPVTYILYFDQTFLTVEGRIRSMEMAREMIPELIEGGNRAMIVSSGRNVTTYADLTSDVDALVTAIGTMEQNHDQWWDPTARPEEARIREVLDALQNRGADQAASLAKFHQAEERWRAEKAMRRFSMVVNRLTDVPQPKAILYFADRMRSNPGEHYLSYFNNVQVGRNTILQSIETDSAMSAHTFDRVVNEANANGARLYTIQAEGMTGMGNIEVKSMPSTTQASAGTRHIVDAQNSLVSMAAETGGQAFLRGVSASRITKAIQEELRCVYLVSFDAAGLPRDAAVPVLVRVDRDKVKVHHRGQVFLQSETNRLTSRLMAAFAAPDAIQGSSHVRAALVPTGFVDGKYTAMIQVGVDGSPLPGAEWDMGVSVLSSGKVREDAAERVKVGGAGTPVVFEKIVSFTPGPFEMVFVAHETQTDEISTGKIEGEWPDLDGETPITLGPIAVMQPARAVFLRDGEVKTSGAAGHHETLEPQLPTAMISLVCWGKKEKDPIRIVRQLVGDSSAEFEPMDLTPDDQRCAQIRDVIRAGTMTDGEFSYEIKVYRSEDEVASAHREFVAYGGEPENLPAGS